MPRIVGVNIPQEKKIEIALTYIFGIGRSLSKAVLKEAGINPDIKASELNPEQINKLKEVIEKNHRIEGDLKKDLMVNIRRLKDIGSWRGHRHIKRLPVRGQRTKTNNRTVRGNVRKTVGSGKKGAPAPK
ncbi:30S ribosomal protein S13 [Patescibacteria group bacterium]|nr:30S ribosomal protein S13 [Patescibacteria group bacterium]